MRLILVVFAALFFFVGCRSKKEFTEVKFRPVSERQLISQLIDNQPDFYNFFIKRFDGVAEYDGNRFTFKGALSLKNDSQIVISIMPIMGIELFKASITTDQIQLIDKTKRQVLEGNLSHLAKQFNLQFGFQAIQSVFSNRIEGFECSTNQLFDCLKEYRFEVLKDGYQLQNINERRLSRLERQLNFNRHLIQMHVQADNFRLKEMYIKDLHNDGEMRVKYSNFTNFDGFIFPKNIEIEGNAAGKKVMFSMDISQLEKNSKNDLGFKIPERYERVGIK
jgi:hypothetical protein